MQLTDSVFLISGGASGLGEACARRLVAGGGRVVIADLNDELGEAVAASLGEAAVFCSTDVTSEASVLAAVELAQSRFGALHGVVSCAGVLGASRVVGREAPHDLDLFRKVIEVNLVGVFNVMRLAAAAMTENEPNQQGERGVVINTSSVSAFEGQIGQAAYAASKGGVASMSLPVARELARFGIRVVAIAPGVFATPMMGATSEELRSSLASQIPFPPRLGEPDEFAMFVQSIVENPMINGCTLRLDGAMRMGAK